MTDALSERQNVQLTGPYDSLRDFVAALEARGRLIRIKEMDQDRYEATAFMYRLIDRYGYDAAPGFLIERLKIDGEWREGPIVANLYGGWDVEAMPFGIETKSDNQDEMYRTVLDNLLNRLDEGGQWKRIKPTVMDSDNAPCKDVILTGDDIDITKYPWFFNIPADGGRYINTGTVFTQDDEFGRNVGVYRCMLKGKNKITVAPTPGQDGWRMLMGMKARGDQIAKVAIAVGVDPITWAVAATKFAAYGEDEMEVAGGLKGSPMEMVQCETCDITVPAHAEMIIEGEIPLNETESEGPYGELYGYLGKGFSNTFYMNIKAITHRHQPMFFNSFTGVSADMPKGPQTASEFNRYKKLIPNLEALYGPRGAIGVTVISIDKKFVGEGMAAGQHVAASTVWSKVVIVVDKDISVLNPLNVLHALGARWQPSTSLIIPQTQIFIPDPSSPKEKMTSKIVIDATRQFPEEGGPETFPAVSRILLEDGCPDAFELVDSKWDSYFESVT